VWPLQHAFTNCQSLSTRKNAGKRTASANRLVLIRLPVSLITTQARRYGYSNDHEPRCPQMLIHLSETDLRSIANRRPEYHLAERTGLLIGGTLQLLPLPIPSPIRPASKTTQHPSPSGGNIQDFPSRSSQRRIAVSGTRCSHSYHQLFSTSFQNWIIMNFLCAKYRQFISLSTAYAVAFKQQSGAQKTRSDQMFCLVGWQSLQSEEDKPTTKTANYRSN